MEHTYETRPVIFKTIYVQSTPSEKITDFIPLLRRLDETDFAGRVDHEDLCLLTAHCDDKDSRTNLYHYELYGNWNDLIWQEGLEARSSSNKKSALKIIKLVAFGQWRTSMKKRTPAKYKNLLESVSSQLDTPASKSLANGTDRTDKTDKTDKERINPQDQIELDQKAEKAWIRSEETRLHLEFIRLRSLWEARVGAKPRVLKTENDSVMNGLRSLRRNLRQHTALYTKSDLLLLYLLQLLNELGLLLKRQMRPKLQKGHSRIEWRCVSGPSLVSGHANSSRAAVIFYLETTLETRLDHY